MSNACHANTASSSTTRRAPRPEPGAFDPAKPFVGWDDRPSATPAPRDCDCNAPGCLICEVENLRG